MRYKLLGRTGLRVSELCLGAMIFRRPPGRLGPSSEHIVGELVAAELARLEEVSRIQLGFPHDFDADRLAYGTTRPLIDSHRAYGPGQARRHT